ncbi:MFS transporter [Patescibacteria group bacterium]|nr:MFS transporter [Patescibacteria group bacterium]
MANQTIKTYLLITAASELLIGLHAAIYVTYLMSNDLSLLQVSLVNFFFMLSVFVLEIPTGAIADIFGRKFSFVLSNIICGAGFLVYSLSESFTGFVASEIIIALGLVLSSGAFKAWMVDSLNFYQWEGKLINVFKLEGRIGSIASMAGGLIGAYLGVQNLAMPFAIAGTGFLILAITTFALVKEEYFVHKKRKDINLWNNIRQISSASIKYGLKHQVVFLIVSVTVVFTLGFQALNMYWQPWFTPHISGSQYLGYIWVGIIFCKMLGIEMVGYFEKRVPNFKIGYLVIGTSVGTMIMLSAIPFLKISIIAFILHEVIRGLSQPYTNTMIQENITSSANRATIDSFISMMRTGAAGIGLLLAGILSNAYGISITWMISGIIIIVLTPVAMIINGHD